MSQAGKRVTGEAALQVLRDRLDRDRLYTEITGHRRQVLVTADANADGGFTLTLAPGTRPGRWPQAISCPPEERRRATRSGSVQSDDE